MPNTFQFFFQFFFLWKKKGEKRFNFLLSWKFEINAWCKDKSNNGICGLGATVNPNQLCWIMYALMVNSEALDLVLLLLFYFILIFYIFACWYIMIWLVARLHTTFFLIILWWASFFFFQCAIWEMVSCLSGKLCICRNIGSWNVKLPR